MKTLCRCCDIPLGRNETIDTPAKTALCQLCMRSVVLHSPRTIHCKTHKNILDPKEITP